VRLGCCWEFAIATDDKGENHLNVIRAIAQEMVIHLEPSNRVANFKKLDLQTFIEQEMRKLYPEQFYSQRLETIQQLSLLEMNN
jgi:ferredoxin-fold anticodon binding domain-containing protein